MQLERALADAKQGEAQLLALVQQVRYWNLAPNGPVPADRGSSPSNSCPEVATVKEGVENSNASLQSQGGKCAIAGSSAEEALGVSSCYRTDYASASGDQAHADAPVLCQDIPVTSSDTCAGAATGRDRLANMQPGLDEHDRADKALPESGNAASAGGNALRAQTGTERKVTRSGNGVCNGNIGFRETDNDSHEQADIVWEERDKARRDACDAEEVNDIRVTQEQLEEAWGIVEHCLPGFGALACATCGSEVNKVLQVTQIVSEAQKDMTVVLQKWVAIGEAEVARNEDSVLSQFNLSGVLDAVEDS